MRFRLTHRLLHRKKLEATTCWLATGARIVPLRLVPNPRARRYVLRLAADGMMRVTIPRGGSALRAREFAAKHSAWLEKQLLRRALEPRGAVRWPRGTEILLGGERIRLEAADPAAPALIKFGAAILRVENPDGDLRPEIEAWLWQLARQELPARVLELAGHHGLTIRRVTVRNQRSRWGSCSRRGTISLNWRLVQAPEFVRDYIILHELAHLKEMNHTARFWTEVARLCPGYEAGEAWLKQNATALR